MSNGLVLIMAIACGISVANLYYAQPLLSDIRHAFHATSFEAGIVSTLTQVGYACGLFLFVPLGDSHERRKIILRLLIGVTIALIAVAFAMNLVWLYIASFAVGLLTVVPQMIVPFAVHLASPEERGKVVGNVMSGLLVGILLARTLAGFVGSALDWRAMYLISAGFMLVLAVVLRLKLPAIEPTSKTPYRELLKSLGTLTKDLPPLRDAALLGAMSFGAFSVFWTVLSFYLSTPPYHYGAQVAGLFGIVGVAGAMISPVAGRLADRLPAQLTSRLFTIVTLLSFVVLWFLGYHLIGLIVGVILLDLGVQGTQISNQARIYSLHPEARNRLNTVYMVTYFLGGSLGSSIGSLAWTTWGWAGVCLAGIAMIVVGLLAFLIVGDKVPTLARQKSR